MSEDDLELMARALRKNPVITMKKLREVFQRCSPKNLPTLLLELCKETL